MALDGITLQLLTTELDSSLSGTRIDKVFQPDKHTIMLHLRGYSGIKKLLISILPSDPHINLTDNLRDNPQMPPSFCMLLRKYISGARILSVTNPGYERLIEFSLSNTDELHDDKSYRLIVELMGRFANIILVNGSGKIIDSAVHVDFQISRVREVMPARIYEYPQSQDKYTPEECLDLLADGRIPVKDEEISRPLSKALLNSIKGLSPNLARAILTDAKIDERYSFRDLDDGSIAALTDSLRTFMDGVINRTLTYYVCLNSSGDICDYSLMKIEGYPVVKSFSTVSGMLEEYYNVKEANINIDVRRHRLNQIVTSALNKMMRKYEYHISDYEEARNNERYKLYGDLLLGAYSKAEHGDSITLSNYYDDPPTDITIPLDPSLSIAANAQEYYRQYRKCKRRMEISSEYIAEDELSISYLRTLKTLIASAATQEDIEALEEEINSEIVQTKVRTKQKANNTGDPNRMVGISKSGKASSRALRQAAKMANARQKGQSNRNRDKHKSEESLSFRRFRTSDGYECLSGRNNFQNDRLTFQIADKDDWWFHVKGLPGTHVILKSRPGEEFPSDTAVTEAASAAAFYSRATLLEEHANMMRVEVDYCKVSHIKKIPRSKPGMVIYDSHYSIVVEAKDPEDKSS
ncbi:Predicted component of the ribosome quality control (RQC) complex, YloA/Tae2 family, contains fibronectin-binding (FbpA) and DUF814 domains [Ruminococcaceae bacterium YRB3002]|nr:Predicted component of the ribosome quality control (RQC) complex, YloA/Tae2 family, contains fibronectin-binding (FbpA) and DUF814 domains [Ruminococcaceae bacterium YRB3002]